MDGVPGAPRRRGKPGQAPRADTANTDLLAAVGLGVREFSRLDSAFRSSDKEAHATERSR